ncbi:MAG TPA: MFS transporter [Candidatus Saccharimonadales bacterium]|nr:MFS transporter [Candidatus Saccharimonadales bacterium]
MQKPRLSFWQIWNMSFGFLGIQFGWGLQMANMSAIYSKLGAEPSKIPLLWLAGPVTGLMVQPLIGALSDRTWGWLGRRRPYFLFGAALSSVALFSMPDAPILWVAAGMLWVLDSSINISMEPFRAFVADLLPVEQQTAGFVMQSFFIGIGAAAANAMPDILSRFGVTGNAANGIPLAVQYSFKMGAAVFLLAVLWTVFTTKEYPPENIEEWRQRNRAGRKVRFQPSFVLGGAVAGAVLGAARGALVDHHFTPWHLLAGAGIGGVIGLMLSGPDVAAAIGQIPKTMKQLAVVQFFTWIGLFCMWMFFGLATAQQVFHTTDPQSKAFDEGTIFGGRTFMWYSIVCFAVAFVLPVMARRTSRKIVHELALTAGGVSLVATCFIHDPILWQCTMIGVGVAWASILAMPYAILAGALPPERVGVYMGIFNFFIVIPEIVASLGLEPIVKNVFGNDPVKVVAMGGVSMLVAAVLMAWVTDDAKSV